MKAAAKLSITLLILFNILCSTAWASNKDNQLKLLAFSGSSRADSYNKKALMLLVNELKNQNVAVTYIDLADFTMPLYNGDLESQKGLPENTKKLQNLIAAHDGLLIASPEYNGFPSPVLINTIDWATREEKGNANSGTKIFQGKFAAIIATSPGKSGGSRGLAQLKQFLNNVGVKVIAEQTAIPNAMQVFDAEGEIKNEEYIRRIKLQASAIHKVLKASYANK